MSKISHPRATPCPELVEALRAELARARTPRPDQVQARDWLDMFDDSSAWLSRYFTSRKKSR